MTFEDFNALSATIPFNQPEDRSEIVEDFPEEPSFLIKTSQGVFKFVGTPTDFVYFGTHFTNVSKFMKEFDLADVSEYEVIVNGQVTEFGFR